MIRVVGAAALVALAGARGLAGQDRRPALGAAIVLGEPAFAGAGVVLSVPVAYQVRVRALAAVGTRGGAASGRGEATVDLLLSPRSPRWGVFAGVGLAGVTGGAESGGYLLVTLGLERSPARHRGWWIEAGVGGGARLAVGYRVPLEAVSGRRATTGRQNRSPSTRI